MLWAGTSGAWLGIERDNALVAAIDRSLGVRATTATLGLLEAFGALRVARYGLVVPYLASVTEAIVTNFRSLGFDCAAKTCEGLSDNWQFSTIDAATLADRVRTVARSRPDAIVIHCTNVGGAAVVEDLEAELGVPVVDSVVVGLWSALRGLGIDPPRAGFGRLAALPTAAPIAPGSRR
jgi:maleate isomerase